MGELTREPHRRMVGRSWGVLMWSRLVMQVSW